MSYLVRVLLPDTPGSLGQLAESFGLIDANIQSVDVVHPFPDGTVIDDIVVTLPAGSLPDSLITAAQSVDGVRVDSLRPFSGTVARHGQIRMLADVALKRRSVTDAMTELVTMVPRTAACGWCIVLDTAGAMTRIAASGGAPEDDGTTPEVTIEQPRRLDPETEAWIPPAWGILDSSLAATPLFGTSMILVIGRPGGPEFIDSEVDNLGCLGTIVGSLMARPAATR